jgi:FtsH-binding integral membrane protein
VDDWDKVPSFDAGEAPRRSTSSLDPVHRTYRTLGLAIWAVLAVPLVFAAYVGFAYHVALTHRDLPFLPPREWRWYVAYLLALGSGVLAVALVPLSRPWARITLTVAYLGIMGFALVAVSLAVSCANGDYL